MTDQLPNLTIQNINTRLQATIHKETLGKAFWVSGIVKQKYQSDRGHIYFDLEDASWSIYCMLPNDLRNELGFTIQNHMLVEVLGDIRFYDRQGRVQIQIQQIKLIERGAIPDFRDAEKYLRSKGLWGLPPKKLPQEIKSIYLITSARSKAVEDFRAKYYEGAAKHKIQPAQITIEDVPLEGEFAPKRIAESIHSADTGGRADVIVITRGGGDFTALATFNDPIIAEAICRAEIPIVVGVGHETDNVFAEKVADVRAISPTDAADKIVQAQQQKNTPCVPIFTLLVTLFSLVSSLVLWALLFMPEI